LAFFFQISFIIKTLISNLRCLAAISISGKGPSYGSNSSPNSAAGGRGYTPNGYKGGRG